ncbi:MAG: protein translocase subunit SecD [Actinomycetota bacterium]
MQRKLLGTLIGIVVIAFGGLTATLIAGNSPSLGLDLQGGISVTQQPVGDYDPAVLDLAVERIRDRVDSLGVAEPEIIRQGDAIVVNLPGVKNQQEAIELVQVTGQVYLRPVEGCLGEGVPTTTTDPAATTIPGAPTTTAAAPTTTAAGGPSRRVSSTPTTDPGATTPPDATAPDTSVPASGTTIAGDPVPATSVPVDAVPVDAQAPVTSVVSDPTSQQLLPLQGGGQCLVGAAGGSGTVFENDARADILDGGWGVTVGLRRGSEGEDIWNALAGQCFSQSQACPSGRLAIELDGTIVSAPSVNVPQFSGNVQITGSFTESEARDLARVLKSGSLPVRMETQSVQNVSPTLGKDSLRAAIVSGIIGVALVLLFLMLYYRLLGVVVVAGLLVSGSLLYSVISLLSRTQGLALSLAGVAGIIVSVGVTVDSYVVFFERLKDEVRSGRTMRNSAVRGFAGAWRTILVADVVSLIGAFTLWYLTVGSVRNFAFFLGLSTLADLVVAYFFTRPAVLLLARTDWMARRKVMGIEVSRVAVAGARSES